MHAATHATAHVTASFDLGTPCAGRPWWARLARSAAAEYRTRRALRQLAELDEHMLRDLGLGRGGLERAARFGRDR